MISYLTSCDRNKRNLAPSRARGRRIGSTLRVLAFALALLGTTTSVVFADHMGNHARPLEKPAGECGEGAAELGSTALYGPGTGEVFSAESAGASTQAQLQN
jgi:hypothetical protein